MNKSDKIGFYNKDNNDLLSKEVYKNIEKEDRVKEIKRLYGVLKKNPEKLTLDDLRLLMKLESRSSDEIKLDFKDDGYLICKKNLSVILDLHDYTKSFLYSITHMITHDGRLKYGNNKIIPSLTAIKTYLRISNDKWNKYIKPDIEKYNIIKKERIDNKWCLLLSPIYATTTRKVTETMFIAFYNELKEHLHKLDYIYLKKFHNIDV